MSVPTARNQGDLLPDHAYPLGPPEAFASFNALFDHRVQHYPDDPFLSDLTRHLNYSQADKCINTLAKLHGERIVPRRKGEPGKAVGMLWRAGMDYVLHDIALQRLGHIPVAISPSLPPSAIISILRSTEAVALIHGPDQLKSAQAAITDLPGVTLIQVDTHDVPPSDNTTWRTELSPEEESQEVNSIIHTSGSTGDPKIIPMRNRPWLANCCSYPGGPGACLVVTPLSHAYARLALIGTVAYAGRFIVYPPTMPITAPNLMKAIRESKPEMIWVVPTLVKMIAEEPGGIDLLTGLGIVGSAGGPVPTELGDSLVANGVHLVVTLGASEAGNVFSSSRDYDTDRHWEYMRPPTFAIKYMHFESVEDGLAELVVDSKYPSLQMCNRPDGSWASGDLYELHETMKNAWRYFGRRDDLIVHSTGHKTNPIPMEHKLRSSPLIRDAMVVGTNRPQPAVLFIPADPTNSDLTSLIEEINASIPKHSRIVPELVKSLPPTSEFLVSDKRSLKRTKSVALFQSEIDDLYTAYAGEADGGEELKDLNAAKDVVSAVLSRMFDRIIGMDEDLFDLGMDSLAAIQVRNTIQRRVSLPSPLVPNVVFENPTPAALAQHLWAHATGEASVAVDMDQEARRMVEEGRAALLPRHKTSNGHAINGHAINGHAINGDAANGHSMNGDKPKTVLLTGATGSLGSHVLQQLVRNGIKKITCPVRAKDDSHAIERVEESLRRRKLPSIKKLEASGSRIVCLASDLSDPRLGLSHERYHDLRSEIGSTIHAAWPVNFNLPLSSFQPHVTATVNLLNLTAASRFILLSSVSVASRWPEPTLVPEDTLPDPTVAESIGYAKSKWVAETLTSSAGGTIIRVGQLCGDSVHGVWNENEAVPAVIKAAQIMGSLPATLPGGSNWLPVDDAAKAITTLSTAKDGGGVYNLVNPTPTPWTKVLDCLAEPKNLGEGVDVIPFAQWVENLREATDSTDDMEGNPALKLVGYFTTEKEWKEVEFDTEALRRDSGVEFGRVGGEEVGRMLKAWRGSGFLR